MTPKLWPFYQSLHSRDLTTQALASLIGSSRSHVTEVLNNKPGHGHHTRPKLFPYLTKDELKALGWWEEYNRHAERKALLNHACSTRNNVPKRTLLSAR